MWLKNNELKLAGFRISRVLNAKSTMCKWGTPCYQSPEIWEDKGYDFKSDVWYVFIIHDK